MAYHYSANQYEAAYKPTVLRNWEVPKQYNDHPKKRLGRTRIISNDKGHLLPGVPRSPNCPWGNFVGTWDLPQKIDRATANELSGLSRIKPKYHQRQTVSARSTDKEEKVADIVQEPVEPPSAKVSAKSLPKEEPVEKSPETAPEPPAEKLIGYIPGDLTEDKYKLPTHEILVENQLGLKNEEIKTSANGYPKYRDDFFKPLPKIIPKEINRQDVEDIYLKNKEMIDAPCPIHHPKTEKKPPSPLISAIKNFQLARKLHKENLEHDPLPDTITHSKYRHLQMQRSQGEPGLALNEENFATGVGWKGYPGYGPTRCTKLKVYRPKTCQAVGSSAQKNDGRPSSVTSFDRKWRFIRQRKVTPIELAICWDMRPENPQDEPKRTPHIDGSNGSLAPAVFSLVHTPKEEEEVEEAASQAGSLFEKAPGLQEGERDFVLDRPKTRKLSRGSSSSGSGESHKKKRAKSAYNLDDCVQCKCEDIHQSTPNLSECGKKSRRLCMACEMKNVSLKDRPKSEFKMAFKAGVPQNNNKKNKDKRQDYPEHWRLATVYQHSYKPIHFRKRPLLATVFK